MKQNNTKSCWQGETVYTELNQSDGSVMLLITLPTKQDAIAVMSRVSGYSDALGLDIPAPQFNPHKNGTTNVTLAYMSLTSKQVKRIRKYLGESTTGNRQKFETEHPKPNEELRKRRADWEGLRA